MTQEQLRQIARKMSEEVASNQALCDFFDAIKEIDDAWADWDFESLIRLGCYWRSVKKAALIAGDGKLYYRARYLARECGESLGEILWKIRRVQRAQ